MVLAKEQPSGRMETESPEIGPRGFSQPIFHDGKKLTITFSKYFWNN
jgi:hypothetical protein